MKTGMIKIIILTLFYGGVVFAGTFLNGGQISTQTISEDRISLEKKYNELSAISLNRGLFSDTAFRQLINQSISIDKVFDKGRPNPFLPIGEESKKIENQKTSQTLSEILSSGVILQDINDVIISEDLSGGVPDNQ